MKTFVIVKSNGEEGPKIKAKDFNEAEKLLKSLTESDSDNFTYRIVGEEIIIPLS